MDLGGLITAVGANLETLTGYGVLILGAVLVITRKLIWHKDHTKAVTQLEAKVEKWENIAISALSTAEKMTVQAEVTNALLSKVPDPGAQEEGQP